MFLVILYLVISTLAEACKGDAANQCESTKCETCDVTIGGKTYCSKCATKATEFPINGKCVMHKEEVSKQRVFFWLSRGWTGAEESFGAFIGSPTNERNARMALATEIYSRVDAASSTRRT